VSQDLLVTCPRCKSHEFEVVDDKTGLLKCTFCKAKWTDERFVKLSHTDKFIKEQSKRPAQIANNSSETDEKLLGTILGLTSVGSFFGGLGYRLKRLLRRLALALLIIALVVAVIYFATN
jgi:transcription initiation factor TFIIIB Brf1 subunit/transcription initiation factor TFIIB